MQCIQYNTGSIPRKINKQLKSLYTTEFYTLETVDAIRPVISLRNFNHEYCNYIYLEKYNRYYFVRDWTIRTNGVFVVSLEVDVLQSYANLIMWNDCDIVEAEEALNEKSADYTAEDVDVRLEYPIASPFTDNREIVLIGV